MSRILSHRVVARLYSIFDNQDGCVNPYKASEQNLEVFGVSKFHRVDVFNEKERIWIPIKTVADTFFEISLCLIYFLPDLK